MGKRRTVLFALPLLALLLALPAANSAQAIVIAADLSHGESDKYLADMETAITKAYKSLVKWKRITEFTAEALADVDILILGQPTVPFTPAELNIIKEWFGKGGKVLWVAADSDYGPGPGCQDIANAVLEKVGSILRIDLCSVESPKSPMGAGYRVDGYVRPDPGAELVGEGVTKPVLFHGPGVVAYTKPDGMWESLAKSKPGNVYRIVWTREDGEIVENNPPEAKAHKLGETGSFVLLAVEKMAVAGKVNLVIASGESPYGDYEPTWSSKYKDVELDGPKFITNLVAWLEKTLAEAPPAPADYTMVLAATVILIIILAAAALYLYRKKKPEATK